MKKTLKIVFSGVFLLGFGCAHNTAPDRSMTSVDQIDEEKRERVISNNVQLGGYFEYKAYIDKDNKISQLCSSGVSCITGSDESESVGFGSSGYGLNGSVSGISCGKVFLGSHESGGKEAIKVGGHKEYPPGGTRCDSRFYKTDYGYIGLRALIATLSVGLSIVIDGTEYEKVFNHDSLVEVILDSRLDEVRNLVLKNSGRISGNVAVVYVSAKDAEDDINAFYDKLNDGMIFDGIVLIDAYTNKPLKLVDFNANNDAELTTVIQRQINDVLSSLSAEDALQINVKDIEKHIPPEVILPKLPSVPVLTKSEYETKSQFGKRVEIAVAEREEAIRELQSRYNADVKSRNNYIKMLAQSWQEYQDNKADSINKMSAALRKNKPALARLLYALNAGKFDASAMSYDAETQHLYFSGSSTRMGFDQKMRINVPPDYARNIKEHGKYKLMPDFQVKGNVVHLAGFDMTETDSGKSYRASYTDIAFKPDAMSVSVKTGVQQLDKKVQAAFEKYEQKPQSLVANDTTEILYIETRKYINAKMPDWFEKPEQSSKVLSYGSGISQEEAMTNARKDLAYMVKTTVSSSLEILKQDNTFRSFQDVREKTRAETSVELSAGDYRVYRQAEADGRYYVALCYKCDGK